MPAPIVLDRWRRRTAAGLAIALVATLLAVPLETALAPPAAASTVPPAADQPFTGKRCAPASPHRLSGSVQGEDGRFVSAQIAFDIFDRHGRKIDLGGCVLGREMYGAAVWVNRHKFSGHGSTSGSGSTKSWSAELPSNAHEVWIEAYPRTNDPDGTGATKRGDGDSTVRYGKAMRRAVRVPTGQAVHIRFPVRCTAGGRTGSVSGRFVVNGQPARPDWVNAWDNVADTPHQIMGWGMGKAYHGGYRVEPLASDRAYAVWAHHNGVTHQRWEQPVGRCGDRRVDFIVGHDVRGLSSIAGLADVPARSFFAAPAAWAAGRGITTGVGGTDLFQPGRPVTRAELVTFLWRAAGQPAASRHAGFSDVASSSFYARATSWARHTGVTTGVGGSGRFEPNRPVTRAEAVTMFWRAAGQPSASNHSGFVDVPHTAYFASPVTWAAKRGVTTGVGGSNRFEPHRDVTRAESVTFLWRARNRPAVPKPANVRSGCGYFATYADAKAFYDLYARHGDVAKLRSGGKVCPFLPGAPQW